MTVADQRATQKLLTAALNILKGFYAKKAKAALMQVEEPAGPPPPPGFSAYNKNAAAGGVMGMIQQIINDAKAMEAEVIRSEEDAQKAYARGTQWNAVDRVRVTTSLAPSLQMGWVGWGGVLNLLKTMKSHQQI